MSRADIVNAIAAARLLGFESATNTSIPRNLYNYSPSGATALRDAII